MDISLKKIASRWLKVSEEEALEQLYEYQDHTHPPKQLCRDALCSAFDDDSIYSPEECVEYLLEQLQREDSDSEEIDRMLSFLGHQEKTAKVASEFSKLLDEPIRGEFNKFIIVDDGTAAFWVANRTSEDYHHNEVLNHLIETDVLIVGPEGFAEGVSGYYDFYSDRRHADAYESLFMMYCPPNVAMAYGEWSGEPLEQYFSEADEVRLNDTTIKASKLAVDYSDFGSNSRFLISPDGILTSWDKPSGGFGDAAADMEMADLEDTDEDLQSDLKLNMGNDVYNEYRNEGYMYGVSSSGAFLLVNTPELTPAQASVLLDLVRDNGLRNVVLHEGRSKQMFSNPRELMNHLSPIANS